MKNQLSPSLYKRILQFQRDEISGSILYEYIARRQKNEDNKFALLEIAEAERNHYEVWKGYTGKDAGPDWVKITLGKIISRILGDTFTIKFFESSEDFGIRGLQEIEKEIPEAFAIVQEEEEHE
ncbi:MAG: hypothetical protein QM683_18375, partial [Lacrimispora sp.]